MLIPNISSFYRGRSVLITGGLGFIGSNLARRLIEMGGTNVVIVDALVADQGGNIFNIEGIANQIKLHIADMSDEGVANQLVGGVDYIFNLAGNISHLDSMHHPQRDLEMNCRAQLALLEACRNFNTHVKIVFASTRQIYGTPLYLPIDENHRVAPLDINGIHKFAAEQYHLLYHRVYGTRAVCLRLTNTYGPRQLLHHDRQGFVAWFIRKAMDGDAIELYGGGRQLRDINYVDDVVEALLLAGASESAEGQIYNLGAAPVSLCDLADKMISLTQRGTIRRVPFPPERQAIDIGNAYLNFQKIESALGWRPRTPLHLGLTLAIDFYQRNRAHYWKSDARSFSRFNSAIR